MLFESIICLLFILPSFVQAKAFDSANQFKTEQVQANLVLFSPDGVSTKHKQWVALYLKHQVGWHTYWKNPGDTGLATHLSWTTPSGISIGKTLWPLPKKIQIGELINYGYENEALLVASLQIDAENAIPTEGANIKLHASWLICKNECIPQESDFAIKILRNQISTIDSTLFQQVIEDQPFSISKNENHLTIEKDQKVNIKIFGLDPKLQNSNFEIFPEIPDILDTKGEKHSLAKQFWIDGTWNAVIPINSNRTEEPKFVPITLISASQISGLEHRVLSVDLKVDGQWPKELTLNSDQSTNLTAKGLDSNTVANQSESVNGSVILISAFAALIGGLILNLMPCVLPVLAIKAMSFVKTSSHQRRQQQINSYFYAFGVILSFLILGGTIFLLKGVGIQLGWGFQLQSPIMLVILSFLFTLIALNLLGIFELGGSLQNAAGKFKSDNQYIESFGTGVLAVFIASPCTAPFMGASLGTALGLQASLGMVIFAFLGIGFSLPIVILASIPKVNHLLPKPGAWMNQLKVFMSFPMLATVLWLAWIFGNINGLDAMCELLGLLLMLACGIYLTSSQFLWSKPRQWTMIHTTGVLIICTTIFLSGFWIASMNESASGGKTVSTNELENWSNWSQAKVNQTLSEGHPVFIDYTAAWCITCKINESTTLKNSEITSTFAAKKVRLFKADWTHQDANIAESLKSLGRVGVPVYVLTQPGGQTKVFSEVIGKEELLTALNQL
jgi:thiol:disulfide interchange protein DsbD